MAETQSHLQPIPPALNIALPAWLSETLHDSDDRRFLTLEARMDLVIAAAQRNVSEQGGPFGAAVFEQTSGRLVSLGVNLVVPSGSSMAHAEIVALMLAQHRRGTYDLGALGLPAHDLVTSCEPCAMCFGAVPWSGVRRLVCGAREEDARRIGFDEGDKVRDWNESLQARGITVVRDVQRAQAVAVLEAYAAGGGTLYNSHRPG